MARCTAFRASPFAFLLLGELLLAGFILARAVLFLLLCLLDLLLRLLLDQLVLRLRRAWLDPARPPPDPEIRLRLEERSAGRRSRAPHQGTARIQPVEGYAVGTARHALGAPQGILQRARRESPRGQDAEALPRNGRLSRHRADEHGAAEDPPPAPLARMEQAADKRGQGAQAGQAAFAQNGAQHRRSGVERLHARHSLGHLRSQPDAGVRTPS